MIIFMQNKIFFFEAISKITDKNNFFFLKSVSKTQK